MLMNLINSSSFFELTQLITKFTLEMLIINDSTILRIIFNIFNLITYNFYLKKLYFKD
jgi:transglutaminase/protease-like cytokinesis protein 3